MLSNSAAAPRLCPACGDSMAKTGSDKRIVYQCQTCGMKITVLPGKD